MCVHVEVVLFKQFFFFFLKKRARCQVVKAIKLIVILLWLGKQNELNWRSQNWSSGSDSMYAAKSKACLILTCICLDQALNFKWGWGKKSRKAWESFHWFWWVLTQILVRSLLAERLSHASWGGPDPISFLSISTKFLGPATAWAEISNPTEACGLSHS